MNETPKFDWEKFLRCVALAIQIVAFAFLIFTIASLDAEKKQIAIDYADALKFISQETPTADRFDDSHLPAIPVSAEEPQPSDKEGVRE